MKNMKYSITVLLLLFIGFSNVQASKKKVFIKMVELLAKNDSFADYLDRTPLSETIKMKLIVSDLKIHPVFKTVQEGDNYILVPNAKLLKTKAEFYLLPSNLVIKKDTSSLEFEMVVKNKHIMNGRFLLIPTKPALNYDEDNSTQIFMLYGKELEEQKGQN